MTRLEIITEIEQIERDYKNQNCDFNQYGNSTSDTSDLDERESFLMQELLKYPI